MVSMLLLNYYRHSHLTNYSLEFTGIDVVENPKVKSYKAPNKVYVQPTEKIESESVTKVESKIFKQYP